MSITFSICVARKCCWGIFFLWWKRATFWHDKVRHCNTLTRSQDVGNRILGGLGTFVSREVLGRGGYNWRFKRISIESLPFVARQLYMFCCCFIFFLKCRDSENYFGFSVDVFSELNQTVNKSLGCRNLENIWIMHKTPTLSLWVCG